MSRPKNASFERYGPRHYRSFSKVNKKSFFLNEVYMNMEAPNEMKPNRGFRGHLEVSKKSKIIFI